MAEEFRLRWKDLVTLRGYDNYLKRNHMVTSEMSEPFYRNYNPNLSRVQTRAEFLRDYNWWLNIGVVGTATVGAMFVGGVAAQAICEGIDSLVQKLF